VAIHAINVLESRKFINARRRFNFEYLGLENEKEKKKFEKFKQILSLAGERVLFADVVQKCSRKLQGMNRFLIVTNKCIRMMHADFTSPKQPRPLSDLARVSVTSKKDAFAVLHMRTGGDLILDFGQSTARDGEKISELVGVLMEAFRVTGQRLAVNVCEESISAQTASNDSISAKTEKGAARLNGGAIFKSSRLNLVAHYDEL
jgi:hypothetical protein